MHVDNAAEVRVDNTAEADKLQPAKDEVLVPQDPPVEDLSAISESHEITEKEEIILSTDEHPTDEQVAHTFYLSNSRYYRAILLSR